MTPLRRSVKAQRWRYLLLAALVPAWCGISHADPAAQPASATSALCGGYKRLELKSSKGICVGLVASHLGFARGIAVVGDDLWVADMGGWNKGHGRLLRIKQRGRGKVEEMLTHLDLPNALLALPNGKLLLGSLGRVDEFDPQAAEPGKVSLLPVVTGLPDKGRHPVPALAAAADGALYVNIGSATDHCEGESNAAPNPQAACPETQETPPRGSIIAARWDNPPALGTPAASAKVFARGLRNSMALALDASAHLWAAVNARDFINLADPSLSDEELPHDTLVKVVDGADYGWPQCYDIQLSSPEYKGFPCKTKSPPTLLLPAHAAPLGMLYLGAAHPLGPYTNGLLIGYHGYRKAGHRIVWLQFGPSGEISGAPKEIVWDWEAATKAGGAKSKEAFSDSGVPEKMGSPVALVQLADGSVMATDDHNGTIVIIAASN